MSNLIDGLIEINTNAYFRYDEKDINKFRVIAGGVWRWVTDCIYLKLVRTKEIEPIENIDEEKKLMYWELAQQFLQNGTKEEKISASKCAYITEIITSTY